MMKKMVLHHSWPFLYHANQRFVCLFSPLLHKARVMYSTECFHPPDVTSCVPPNATTARVIPLASLSLSAVWSNSRAHGLLHLAVQNGLHDFVAHAVE